MIKTKEEIEKILDSRIGIIIETSDEKYLKDNDAIKMLNLIHQIRQDDLKEVKKIIKEKGLHLGYKNDILEKLDNLNK